MFSYKSSRTHLRFVWNHQQKERVRSQVLRGRHLKWTSAITGSEKKDKKKICVNTSSTIFVRLLIMPSHRSSIMQRNSMKTKLDQTSMSWVVDTLNSSNNTNEANRFEEITDSDELCNTLLDGTLLCILANSIRPNTIKKFNKNKPNREMMKFKRLENIQKFLTACRHHLCLESFSPFTSSDLEVGGFGGNNTRYDCT